MSSASGRMAPTHIETSVTKLLVATRQLLESLTQWSTGRMTDIDVSDVFVRTGNELNAVITAFGTYGIEMDDLMSVPSELRKCLEAVLSLDPSPENLEIYLPRIREIIVTLLQSLKNKQAVYRRTLQDRQAESRRQPGTTAPRDSLEYARDDVNRARQPSVASPAETAQGPHQSEVNGQGDSRISTTSSSWSSVPPRAKDSNDRDRPGASTVSAGSLPPRQPERRALPSRGGLPSRGVPLLPAPPDAFRPPRQRSSEGRNTPSPDPSTVPFPTSMSQPTIQNPTSQSLPPVPGPEPVRHQLSDNPSTAAQEGISTPPNRRRSPPTTSRFSVDSDFESPRKSAARASSSNNNSHAILQTPQISLMPPSLPPLEDHASVPLLEQTTPNPTARVARESPAALASLTALQNSEQLSRRASKRYSQYQFKQMLPNHPKMPSGSNLRPREGSIIDGSPQRPTRRVSRPPPPVPTTSGSLAGPSGQPLNLGEAFQETSGSSRLPPVIHESPAQSLVKEPIPMAGYDRGTSPRVSPSRQAEVGPATSADGPSLGTEVAIPATEIRVFLQYGRDTKRVMLDLNEVTSVVELQGVFISKFDYSPGAMELFPDVYIKDPSTGIAYHLEDMEEIKPDCLLSLNVDPLDQVRQHFDVTITTLSHEIRDLKNNFVQSRRLSAIPANASAIALLSPSTRTEVLPERQVSQISPAIEKSAVSTLPIATSSFTLDGRTSLGVPRLEDQFSEVQTLRRDLGVLRQVYVDFVSQTKDTFKTIRDQTQAVREVALTKLQGSRAMVDSGKGSLEKQSQDTVQAVEEISDVVDSIKDDVLKRQIMPKPGQMNTMRETLDKVKAQVSNLQDQLSLAAPAWKQTWNQELKNVVDEQQLLRHQEGLAADLADDIAQASEIFETLEQYVAQRQQGMVKSLRTYQPVEPGQAEESVPNLLLEIRTKENDPNRRLRAIELQQKAREKELASKTDDFSNELNGFVAGRKLKKTGGTEEAERLRQKRQEQTLKKLFEGKGTSELLNSPDTPRSDMSSPPASSKAAASGSESHASGDTEKHDTLLVLEKNEE